LKAREKDKLFHFKQFSVRHDRSGMKVGTDGVLLGAWTDVTHVKSILDIGTGTGVIALMLAQRTKQATIHAVEIDKEAYEDATENIASSPWADRIHVHHTSIQEFRPATKFELIVSNPPYFQNSFKPPDPKRGVARHTQQLTFQNVLEAAGKLLSQKGRLNIILPYTEGLEFIVLAEQRNIYCSRKWSFKTRIGKPIERWLLEFSFLNTSQEQGEILLYKEGEIWSDAYRKLTRDFYLKL
jgi:tRNA1Val (adenine37-N6)-methyltransferase